MDVSTIIAAPSAAAVAIAFLWLFVTGKIHSDREFTALERVATARETEIAQLRAALDAERKAVNEQASAGTVTNNLLGAVVALAADRQGISPPPAPVPRDVL